MLSLYIFCDIEGKVFWSKSIQKSNVFQIVSSMLNLYFEKKYILQFWSTIYLFNGLNNHKMTENSVA